MNNFATNNKESTRKCIYCLEEKSLVEFDTEHVVNEAFGTYDGDTPTLHCVCRDCNSTLGRTIDLHLARSTYEGMERLLRGVKSPEPKHIMHANAHFGETLLDMPGPLHGLLMRYELSEDGEVKVIPVPQVGFRRSDTSEWISFSMRDLMENGKPKLPECDKVRMLANTDEDLQALRNKVAEYELPVEETQDLVPPPSNDVWVEVRWDITELVRRSIAKIALNYAAYMRGPDFVLRPHFDPVRRFIRHGEGDCLDFVMVTPMRPTGNEELEGCHFVALEMKRNQDIIAYVSLFNRFTYMVRLVHRYPLWYRLSLGHCFDPTNRSSQPFLVTSLHIPSWTVQQAIATPLIAKIPADEDQMHSRGS